MLTLIRCGWYTMPVFCNVVLNKESWDILSEAFDKNYQSPEKFWKCLQRLEEIDIYPEAINIAYSFLDSETTIKRLTDELIRQEYFNEMQNGIFKIVEFKDFEKTFYVYSVGTEWYDMES